VRDLIQKLNERKIDLKENTDKIRWGYCPSGHFSVKEAMGLASGFVSLPSKKWWVRLWNQGLWTKITLFLWLLMRGWILTWENLRKRRMIGPSVCVMWHMVEETIEHLLVGCDWVRNVWDKGGIIFSKARLGEGTITNMKEKWEEKAFQNAIVNRIWELFPSFVVWVTWKEPNSRVFESRKRSPKEVWPTIHAHIKETLGLSKWGSSDLRASPEETLIPRNWEIHNIPMFVGNIAERAEDRSSPEAWEPPPTNVFKLKFDGALKGNLGPTGFGGAIRDSKGSMVGLYWGYIGENTNNVAKLKGLHVGLAMAANYGWFPIILEGDSQIILQMTTKLLHGKLVNKVADNWRMAHSLEKLRAMLRNHSEVQTHHIKRKSNRLEDLLVNYGVSQ